MFTLDDLKKSRAYQEMCEEAKLEGELQAKIASVPGLIALGLTVEQISTALKLDLETTKKAANL